MANKLTKFLTEAKVELSKVSWSTKDELGGSTSVVIFSVIILAIFIGTCDFILSRAINLLLR